jgi:3-hydroxyisobutyrate dehydrogenase-like beta-hydroxyacid dehydrogenase
MTTAAVIGLGEAGALYAKGLLDAGFTVLGFDPFTRLEAPGIDQRNEIAEAVGSAELVISLVGARAAASVAELAIGAMSPGAVYADFNTASPELKTQMGAVADANGVRFADVAVLAPVPRSGARTPLMASGPGADTFVTLMQPVQAPVESIAGAPGDAAARKLLRSVFMKGLAAVVLESVNAAEQAGNAEWLREQIASEFAGDAHTLIDRLIEGSVQHADRRAHEVEDARHYLDNLGQPSWTTQAAYSWLSKLRDDRAAAA